MTNSPKANELKILFVGIPYSSHTESWLKLLEGSGISVRLFGVTEIYPSVTWQPRKYEEPGSEQSTEAVAAATAPQPEAAEVAAENPGAAPAAEPVPSTPKSLRASVFDAYLAVKRFFKIRFPGFFKAGKAAFHALKHVLHFLKAVLLRLKRIARPEAPVPAFVPPPPPPLTINEQLAQVIYEWQPDIVHTLGIEPASFFYLDTLPGIEVAKKPVWVVQARGGPDIALHRVLPEYRPKISQVLEACDYLIADNLLNYQYAQELGLHPKKISSMGMVPGTGGMDIEDYAPQAAVPPSQRQRVILWPKAYECPQSKALPIFEAIKLAWDQIQPCEIWMTAAIQKEVYIWFEHLPEEIKKHCILVERLPRARLLELLGQARVLLIPSLSDGVPNSLYEAMACGAFPIISPLETITPLVKEEENVLFARNLYPEEVCAALVRAMSDDELVDRAAAANRTLVYRYADRSAIKQKLIKFYFELFDQGASKN